MQLAATLLGNRVPCFKATCTLCSLLLKPVLLATKQRFPMLPPAMLFRPISYVYLKLFADVLRSDCNFPLRLSKALLARATATCGAPCTPYSSWVWVSLKAPPRVVGGGEGGEEVVVVAAQCGSCQTSLLCSPKEGEGIASAICSRRLPGSSMSHRRGRNAGLRQLEEGEGEGLGGRARRRSSVRRNAVMGKNATSPQTSWSMTSSVRRL